MSQVLRRGTVADVADLVAIARLTFTETFEATNDPVAIATYLDTAVTPAVIEQEITQPGSEFYLLDVPERQTPEKAVAEIDPVPHLAGYLKLNEHPAQTDIHTPHSLEIERLYLRQAWQGQGLGRWLMTQALAIAQAKGKTEVWLGVWEHNQPAIQFYEHLGFEPFGTHDFYLGEERQTDWLMRKSLALKKSFPND